MAGSTCVQSWTGTDGSPSGRREVGRIYPNDRERGRSVRWFLPLARVSLDELHGLVVDLLDLGRVDPAQPMTGAGDRDQAMLGPGRGEPGVHVPGLLVGDVGVIGAVDQERGGIVTCDVADRTVGVEPGLL